MVILLVLQDIVPGNYQLVEYFPFRSEKYLILIITGFIMTLIRKLAHSPEKRRRRQRDLVRYRLAAKQKLISEPYPKIVTNSFDRHVAV